MLKVKIEERYLESFEWFLQCYQYLFYYDSGAEVSFNANLTSLDDALVPQCVRKFLAIEMYGHV